MIRLPDGTPVTISDLVHWLRATLTPGTPRPHRTVPGITAERRAQLDVAARAERLERTGIAPGEHPAPVHVDVLDLIDSAPGWAGADQQLDPDAVAWVAQAMSALGLLVDGQQLDALCPWCSGRTSSAPAGGARTLRVRVLRDGRPAVVCEGLCEPPEADVGAEWRGQPAWPLEAEGAWLAGRIEHADSARALAEQQVALMSGAVSATSPCWCGADPVPGQAGACSMAHRKTAERRSQRDRRRGGGEAA